MLAVKGTYDKGIVNLSETINTQLHPANVIVLFMDDSAQAEQISEQSMAMMKAADETGFVQNIIASSAEDVWNDL